MDNRTASQPAGSSTEASSAPLGAALVLASALSWSLGGLIARMADVASAWTTVFWRSGFAALILLAFMLWRDGPRGTRRLFAAMGLPGIVVGLCFTAASTLFIIALQHTTVANVLLMQAGVPLIAALMSRALFGEWLRPSTWVAIAVVILGVGIMVSDTLSGAISPLGDGLALLIAIAFAAATVISRRYAGIRMTPAVCFGSAMGSIIALTIGLSFAGTVTVSAREFGWLLVFGASMALGMALFATGVRMIPSAFAALLGTAETILGPIWVWLAIGETPTARTLLGGTIVLVALLAYLGWQLRENHRLRRIAPPVN